MYRAAWALIAITLSIDSEAASALSWTQSTGFRSVELHSATNKQTGFTLMNPTATGVSFLNVLQGDAFLTNAVAHNGAGLAIGDVDGDGWPDIYFCNLQGPNRLYRNLGAWRFAESELGEAACAKQFSTGAALADVDGDDDLDLLVNGIAAGTRLFLNDGKGKWTEANTGLSRTSSPTSMTLADIDGDGDLDLYCAHYIDIMHTADPTTAFAIEKRGDNWEVTKVNGEATALPRWKGRFEALPGGKVREHPEVHALYRNDGRGSFTAIQFEPGVFMDEEGKQITPYRDWGLAAMFRDMNGDGAPDLYVCNDNYSPDRVWVNSGKGTFRPMNRLAIRHTSRSSMGIDFADIDRDGHDDFIVVDMLARDHGKRMMQLVKNYPDPADRERIEEQPAYNRNTLFFGRADGSYAEAALMAGVAATDWSWCPIFIDVDLDGFEDLLVSNGFEMDVMDQDSTDSFRYRKWSPEQLKRYRQLHPRWRTPNAAFRNRGDGTFEPMSQQWGFDQPGVSYGMALGDLDNDGDLDVVINNLNATAGLYRNNATGGRIALRLKGVSPNTEGIGAHIRLAGGSVTQSQEIICGGRYVSGDQAVRAFAADANSTNALRLEITWRNGDQSSIAVQPNRIYEVDQASTAIRSLATNAPPPKPYFVDASSLLGHVHVENSFADWALQPLLPHRFSRLGPALTWYDIDSDGWEDLIVTASQGGKPAVYTNEQGKKFGLRPTPGLAPTDQVAMLVWPDGKTNRLLLIAFSNFDSSTDQQSQISAGPKLLPVGNMSIGPMAQADIDADGDVDLFVGGRVRAGRFPEPVSSALWLNEQGELRSSTNKIFQSIGLVSGATFSDMDGDGDPDLALALEWGCLRVFRNQRGQFEEMTAQWGFAARTGLWTCIAAGDFNGDGKIDLAAGNWGRNTIYELHRPGPLRIFYEDWNSDGILELIEAWNDGTNWFPMRNRPWLGRGMPELHEHFPSHQAFSKATVKDILGARYEKAKVVEAAYLESSVFLNRGSHFECVALPREAQLTPVSSINVGDFDGDGIEDLFLCQNDFGIASDLTRDDSGRGLWLRGNGDGNFTLIETTISGINLPGEQRASALADVNHDGRLDLAVTQNNGPTKLYLNQHAKRGLRVTLHGPASNPDAIGAQMRVLYPNGHLGPARIQKETTQVLGLAEAPAALWIRWPNGKEQTLPLEDDVWDFRVQFEN